MMDLVALKTEIETDPASLGYGTKPDGEIAGILNLERDTITIDREYIQPEEMQCSVMGSEFVALSDIAQRAWQCIVGLQRIPVKNANIRAQIAAIWGAGTTTRANLVALQTTKGSLAEALFGEGVVVRHQDVAQALRG